MKMETTRDIIKNVRINNKLTKNDIIKINDTILKGEE